MTFSESQLEAWFIERLRAEKYEIRDDIRDRAALENNFRQKFNTLNHVRLADSEFQRLLEEIVTPDVFAAAHTLRNRNAFTRDDGTPLNFTLVNINDWCKNTFEAVSQLRINTDYSHHRYDLLLLINGVPFVQVELKTLSINPRRAIEQISSSAIAPTRGTSPTTTHAISASTPTNASCRSTSTPLRTIRRSIHSTPSPRSSSPSARSP
jgi:type I restriction enzyme R subunit